MNMIWLKITVNDLVHLEEHLENALIQTRMAKYLMPFVEKEKFQLSPQCRLHLSNDVFRDQEEHKIHVDINEKLHTYKTVDHSGAASCIIQRLRTVYGAEFVLLHVRKSNEKPGVQQHYIGLNGVPEGVPSLVEYLADYCVVTKIIKG
ncbi:hypothetical protein ACS0TY_022670 [Phlomoides rotata]